jgi:hypothetical protein
MPMKRMMRSRMALCSLVGALVVLVVAAFSAGSAFAFPTLNSVVEISSVQAPGAEAEQISLRSGSVAMGPYQIGVAGFTPAMAMMCFNPQANGVPTTSALATDSAGAINLFTSSGVLYAAEKINMISWLASQWEGTNPTGKNADINKAMWEIWTDYTPGSGLTVDEASANRKSFYLLSAGNAEDIMQVNQLLADALGNTAGAPTANFLIPLNGNIYDTSKQPFVQPVPEPGTLLLLGSGLVGLGLHGWRKRSKAQR